MVVWLVIAILAAIGEVLTFDLFLASVSAAALVVALLSLVGLSAGIQFAVFAVLSLAGIFYFRPLVKSALGIDSGSVSVHQVSNRYLIGKRGTVTQTVDGSGGQIKLGESEFWSARAFDPDEHIPVGSQAEVLLVDGLTAVVEPVQRLTVPDALEEQRKEVRRVGR